MNKQRHPLVEIKQAIVEYTHLILKTHFTDCRYDYQFGCYVWDQDFKNIQSISKWEHEMEQQISGSVKNYEKRLQQVQVDIKVEEPGQGAWEKKASNRLKRRINILISGQVIKTKQLFRHQEHIYFSPLSIN